MKEDGEGEKNTVVVVVGGFPLTGHHCSICIYSNQKMNTMHRGKQWRAGRGAGAASLLRAQKQPPVSQLHGRDTGKWCGNREAPRAERREGSHLWPAVN